MSQTNPFAKQITLHNILCFGGLLFTLVFVLLNHHAFTYDEPYYLNNVELIKQYGLSDTFLEKLAGPAGPTFAVLHWLLEPVTGLEEIPTRLINVVLLFLSVVFIWLTLKKLNADKPLAKSLSLICVPMVFVCTCMALTEMPALFFLCIAIYLLLVALENGAVIPAIIGGLCMCAAIMGRQPYLLVLLCLPVLLYKKHTNIRRWIVLGLFFLAAILLPLYAFKIWGGLAPHKGGDIATEYGLSPLNFFLSLGYAFLITLFIAPSWLIRIRKKEAIALIITFIIAAGICIAANFNFPVMATVSKKLLPAFLYNYYGAIMGALLVTLGLYFVASAAVKAPGMLNQPVKAFYLLACLFILVSTLKITHQFSSRYVFQAAPFFILFLSDYIKFGTSDIALRLAALIVGIVSLVSYF